MNTDRLMENIMEQIKEVQLKLGYTKESIRLYYPVESLSRLLQVQEQKEGKLPELLKNGMVLEDAEFGEIHFSMSGDRVEVWISPQGVEYVHEHIPNSPFLTGLIQLFRNRHALSIEELCEYFARFNDSYVCEQIEPGRDFDYVLYFPDGKPDVWFYCIRAEMGHTIYHRFTADDYRNGIQ